MTIEKTKDFIKLVADDGKVIRSKEDETFFSTLIYLSYLDDIDNYEEVSDQLIIEN